MTYSAAQLLWDYGIAKSKVPTGCTSQHMLMYVIWVLAIAWIINSKYLDSPSSIWRFTKHYSLSITDHSKFGVHLITFVFSNLKRARFQNLTKWPKRLLRELLVLPEVYEICLWKYDIIFCKSPHGISQINIGRQSHSGNHKDSPKTSRW